VSNNTPLGEQPLRTIKLMLNELVNTLGTNVYSCLGKIPDPDKSYVKSYLKLMIESAQKNGTLPATPAEPVQQQPQQVQQPPSSSLPGTYSAPVSRLPVSTTATKSGDDLTDSYMERLARLRGMLSSANDVAASSSTSSSSSSSSSSAAVAATTPSASSIPAAAAASRAPLTDIEPSVVSSPAKPKATAADVAALKERLQRLKQNSASSSAAIAQQE